MTMRRIAVLGCSGAGKSRLSRAVAEALGLPVIHLDAEFWRPGWVETPFAEWDARQAALFAGDAWVADGNFHRTIAHRLARADTVVHLDFPTWACVRGVLGRWWRQRGEVREDMAAGCPEKIDLEFLRWVLRFRRDVRPAVVAALAEFAARGTGGNEVPPRIGTGRVVVLRSRAEVDAWLAAVRSGSAAADDAPERGKE